jgi:hypothetical protein
MVQQLVRPRMVLSPSTILQTTLVLAFRSSQVFPEQLRAQHAKAKPLRFLKGKHSDTNTPQVDR